MMLPTTFDMTSMNDNGESSARESSRKSAHGFPVKIVNCIICKFAALVSTSCHIANDNLNSETCSIEPNEFRPTMPGGEERLNIEIPSESAGAKKTDTSKENGQTISKMVDLALVIKLNEEQSKEVTKAFKTLKDKERSLNQSLGSVKHYTLFLDFELKKLFANRDPKVQLAIWKIGALLKHQYHGWNTTMPMPGVVVDGHNWTYYLFFESSGNLVCQKVFPVCCRR